MAEEAGRPQMREGSPRVQTISREGKEAVHLKGSFHKE